MDAETHRLNRRARRGVLAGTLVSAVALATASIAWACTPLLPPNHHDIIPNPLSAGGLSVPVNLTVPGVNLPNGGSWSVFQDDDGTVAAGTSASTPTGCKSSSGDSDPVVGYVDYTNLGMGTGEATLQAYKGPGVYEICAAPDPKLTKGYFTFL